jgi:hypothetical protein
MTRIVPCDCRVSAGPGDPAMRDGGGISAAASGAAIGRAVGIVRERWRCERRGNRDFWGVATTPPPHRVPNNTQPTDIRLRIFGLPKRAMDIRATRDTPPTPVLGLWIPGLAGSSRLPRLSGYGYRPPALFSLLRFRLWKPWLAIPAIALRRTGACHRAF